MFYCQKLEEFLESVNKFYSLLRDRKVLRICLHPVENTGKVCPLYDRKEAVRSRQRLILFSENKKNLRGTL